MADMQRRLHEADGLLDEREGMPWTQVREAILKPAPLYASGRLLRVCAIS